MLRILLQGLKINLIYIELNFIFTNVSFKLDGWSSLKSTWHSPLQMLQLVLNMHFIHDNTNLVCLHVHVYAYIFFKHFSILGKNRQCTRYTEGVFKCIIQGTRQETGIKIQKYHLTLHHAKHAWLVCVRCHHFVISIQYTLV